MKNQTPEQLVERLIGFGFKVERINSVLHPPRFIVKNSTDWQTGELLKVPISRDFTEHDDLEAYVGELIEERKFETNWKMPV